jgi:hypothetical protein
MIVYEVVLTIGPLANPLKTESQPFVHAFRPKH